MRKYSILIMNKNEISGEGACPSQFSLFRGWGTWEAGEKRIRIRIQKRELRGALSPDRTKEERRRRSQNSKAVVLHVYTWEGKCHWNLIAQWLNHKGLSRVHNVLQIKSLYPCDLPQVLYVSGALLQPCTHSTHLIYFGFSHSHSEVI